MTQSHEKYPKSPAAIVEYLKIIIEDLPKRRPENTSSYLKTLKAVLSNYERLLKNVEGLSRQVKKEGLGDLVKRIVEERSGKSE